MSSAYKVGRCLVLIEADVGNIGQVDSSVGGRADVEGRIVCDHLGEKV